MHRYEALRILDDPGAAPEGLARVVHEYPDLRPRVARHVAAPPELLDRLASLGNPLVDAALAARTTGPTTSLTTLSLAALRADLPELPDPTPGPAADPVPDPRTLTTPAPLGIPPVDPSAGAPSAGPGTSAGAAASHLGSSAPGPTGVPAGGAVASVASGPSSGAGPSAVQPGLRGRRGAFALGAWMLALVVAVVVLLLLVVLVLGGLFAAADDSPAGARASAAPVVRVSLAPMPIAQLPVSSTTARSSAVPGLTSAMV